MLLQVAIVNSYIYIYVSRYYQEVFFKVIYHFMLLLVESAYNVRDLDSVLGLGRSPGEEKGYPLQYSGLENSMDFMGPQRVGHD